MLSITTRPMCSAATMAEIWSMMLLKVCPLALMNLSLRVASCASAAFTSPSRRNTLRAERSRLTNSTGCCRTFHRSEHPASTLTAMSRAT